MASEPVAIELPISCNDMAELLVVVLGGLGYRSVSVNDRLLQITATRTTKGRSFTFEFFVKFNWSQNGEGTLLKLEVKEQKNSWNTTVDCNKERDAIMDNVLDSAAQMMLANRDRKSVV